MYIIDLARNAIKEKEANEDLYYFIKRWLMALDNKSINLSFAPIYFSIQLASYLGFGINDNMDKDKKYFDLMHGEYIDNDIRHKHIMTEQQSAILHRITSKSSLQLISKDDRNILLNRLLEYYRLHIEGFKELKSLDVIRTVLR